jgi:hypothetical protein
VDDAMRQIMGFRFANSGLCPDAVDDPQPFAQGCFQHFGVTAPGPSRTDTHLAHKTLVD